MVYYAMMNKKLFNNDMYTYDNGVIVDNAMSNYRYLISTKEQYKISDTSVKQFVKKCLIY